MEKAHEITLEELKADVDEIVSVADKKSLRTIRDGEVNVLENVALGLAKTSKINIRIAAYKVRRINQKLDQMGEK